MKEILSPLGMPMRMVNDVYVLEPGTDGYMGMKNPQYLQIFRSPQPVSDIDMFKGDKFKARKMAVTRALAAHLDAITAVLNDGSPFSGLVTPEGAEVDEQVPVRTAAGLKHFLMVNPEIEGKTPGLLFLRGRALRLHKRTYMTGGMPEAWEWLSELALGFVEDGAPENAWKERFDPHVFIDIMEAQLGAPK